MKLEQLHDEKRHGRGERSIISPALSKGNEAVGEDADEDALEGDASVWLEDPPEGFGQQMSRFGILFTLLDSMVTESTLKYLQDSSSDGHCRTYAEVCISMAAPHLHCTQKRLVSNLVVSQDMFLAADANATACLMAGQTHSVGLASQQERHVPLEQAVVLSLPHVLNAMRVGALRSPVEQQLRILISTFHLQTALPSLKVYFL